MSEAVGAPVRPAPQPAVGAWLLVIVALVAIMVLIGGATRLTDSGLSITEWDFIKGVFPPVNAADWAEEFNLYRQTAEYQLQNRGMTLSEFQFIYWWEWGHRFFGKLIGVAFALPLLACLALGKLKGRLIATLGLFALGGVQGFIGWWMVESGLSGRLDVAPYRLATHLGIAFVILAVALALALANFGWGRAAGLGRAGSWRPLALVFPVLLFVQIIAGALVAGTKAGMAFPDWPTVGGHLFPPTYGEIAPFWRNLIENQAAVQFNHRTLGYVVGGLGLAIGFAAIARGSGWAGRLGQWVGALCLFQIILGIVTVVHAAPLALGLMHQATAVALWLVTIAWAKAAWPSPVR